MIAIPAIDIMNGSCVRLFKGRFDQQTKYSNDPADMARSMEQAGIGHLHLVDLDGARTGAPVNLKTLQDITRATSLKVDFGGGIRNMHDIDKALLSGADKVNLGTFLFKTKDVDKEALENFGPEKLIAAVDIYQGQVAVKGWQEQTGISIADALGNLLARGWIYFSVTDIDRDGTMDGPDPDFYKPIIKAFPMAKIIGGGGVATIDHLNRLRSWGLYAAVTGKAVLEGNISLNDLSEFNKNTHEPGQ